MKFVRMAILDFLVFTHLESFRRSGHSHRILMFTCALKSMIARVLAGWISCWEVCWNLSKSCIEDYGID